MARFLLHYLAPFLAPTLCWLLWVWWARRRAAARGEPPGAASVKGPWLWLIAAGAALTAVSLLALALTSGAPKDSGDYRAPRFEGGEIIPPGYD